MVLLWERLWGLSLALTTVVGMRMSPTDWYILTPGPDLAVLFPDVVEPLGGGACWKKMVTYRGFEGYHPSSTFCPLWFHTRATTDIYCYVSPP